ncbi:MAG: hypothetical protein JST68_29340 [Bacteroidetes bacterium]|nr:hypothetical protein [Bacteroidota bacterium]
MAKVQIGDIFEIDTSIGKAYLHYEYRDESMGEIVRVLQGLYASQPDELIRLAESKERFMVYFPSMAAFKKKIVKYAGHHDCKGFLKPEFMME